MLRLESGLFLAIVATLIIAPMGLSHGVAPNPVVNPGFEASLPNAEPLHGTAADECIGVGHQVLYGSDTPQGKAENATLALAAPGDRQAEGEQATNASENGDVNGTRDNATEAAQAGNATVAQDNATRAISAHDTPSELTDEAVFQAGYGHCVFSNEEGKDVAWLNPVRLAGDDAVHWSGHDDDNVSDIDDDGDREIAITTDPDSGHNLWQAWPSPFQAFTANFHALEFDVEAGQVPNGSLVQISLSATPLETQSGDVVLFRDCALNFRGSQLNGSVDDQGHVKVSPLDAGFSGTGDPDCEEAADRFNDPRTTDHERREILGRLRVVQMSFWSFHKSPGNPACGGCSVQLDNIALTHATTVAEEALDRNVNPSPTGAPADEV